MATMVTYIAGVNHRPGARMRLASLLPGEQLILKREPENAYDKNAVAVYEGEMHVGYIPAVDAPAITKALLLGLAVTAVYRGRPATTSIEVQWGDK
jgi:hypothetical protein